MSIIGGSLGAMQSRAPQDSEKFRNWREVVSLLLIIEASTCVLPYHERTRSWTDFSPFLSSLSGFAVLVLFSYKLVRILLSMCISANRRLTA